MNYAQLIFSPTGGTRAAAEIITDVWNDKIETVDLTRAKTNFSTVHFQPEDLVLIAVPSYGGRVPAVAIERISKVHGNGAHCVLLCVYGNRAYEDTLVELEDTAKEAGFKILAAASCVAEHSIMHQYATGRPDEADREELQKISRRILEKLADSEKVDCEILIPGNRPYKKAGGGGLVPKADKTCTKCGICAVRCPVQAISPNDLSSADADKCISCMRCVEDCPSHSRSVNKAAVSVVALKIKKACSVRKSSELFI